MEGFTVWHLFVLLMFVNIALIVHIAVSNKTSGLLKGIFVLVSLFIPLVPYLIWLGVSQSSKEVNASSMLKEAQARALLAEAEAREAEARARIDKTRI